MEPRSLGLWLGPGLGSQVTRCSVAAGVWVCGGQWLVSSVAATPGGTPHLLETGSGDTHPRGRVQSLREGSERGPVRAEFLKLDGDFSAWFLTFPDRCGGGWEMLAQFSGPEVGWRGAGQPRLLGLPGGTSGLGWQHIPWTFTWTEHVPWRRGLASSLCHVVRVRRFSVSQEPGSVVEQTLARHRASLYVWGQVLGAGRSVHSSQGGPWGPHTEQNWKQFSPQEGTHQPLHRVGCGK